MQLEDDQKQYTVVVNQEEQYSIWPVGRALPIGWKLVRFSGKKAACLAHIAEIWKDMTPRSLRGEGNPENKHHD
jgi:MbtH protein